MGVEIIKLKDREYYEENKKYFNKRYNQETKDFVGAKTVGRCSFLYKKYNTNDYQSFAEYYFNDYEGNDFNEKTCKGTEKQGRSLAQFNVIANKMFEKLKFDSNITLEKCFDVLITHVIIETIDGHIVENEIINNLMSHGKYIITNETSNIDSDYNVDITVRNLSSELISYIQVKPISTFLAPSIGVKNDRRYFFKKQEKFNVYLEQIGKTHEIKDIDFMCYEKKEFNGNKHKFLINPRTGKKTFKLYELTDTFGNVILDKTQLKFDYL
jgi:hypothetical protein